MIGTTRRERLDYVGVYVLYVHKVPLKNYKYFNELKFSSSNNFIYSITCCDFHLSTGLRHQLMQIIGAHFLPLEKWNGHWSWYDDWKSAALDQRVPLYSLIALAATIWKNFAAWAYSKSSQYWSTISASQISQRIPPQTEGFKVDGEALRSLSPIGQSTSTYWDLLAWDSEKARES